MDDETKARMLAHIGKSIDAAFAAQPYRGAPSFDDVKVAIQAGISAAFDGPPDEVEEEQMPLPQQPPAPPAESGTGDAPADGPETTSGPAGAPAPTGNGSTAPTGEGTPAPTGDGAPAATGTGDSPNP